MPVDNDSIVLTIGRDNAALHVGTAENTVIHITPTHTVPDREEYFDPTGQRLMVTKDQGAWVFAPDKSGPPVDERVLLGRINAALDHMQQVQMEPGTGQPDEGEVPRPTGPLSKVLDELAMAFEFLMPSPNKGNWLHQLAHKAGVAH